ncbi:hypothetical protein PPL_05457 [Heterostelium album PN500]|uniref:Uncharacterized protein n=1 Tax=Heterostelium pallidum (strain ATCC 26659 / Pp 5 / PN500) TaxID=670386 RepID=D3BA82_HETP5|nr:hypothetical protein PPL_05457 [Heterostelium album PN500]EFA81469.1 hypothetical protein PPL_05457 [Heterostelium album PN500]|eukprot:XP_020433587.1 hypothetical protein PPL_05457 [Heterostelium album PN500]
MFSTISAKRLFKLQISNGNIAFFSFAARTHSAGATAAVYRATGDSLCFEHRAWQSESHQFALLYGALLAGDVDTGGALLRGAGDARRVAALRRDRTACHPAVNFLNALGCGVAVLGVIWYSQIRYEASKQSSSSSSTSSSSNTNINNNNNNNINSINHIHTTNLTTNLTTITILNNDNINSDNDIVISENSTIVKVFAFSN